MSKILKGFKDFILRGNAVELAVGFVIGAAFNTMIQAIVKDLLTPFIGIFTKTPEFSGLSFSINSSIFRIGDLVNAVVSFLLIAVAIYFFVILPMNAFFAVKTTKREEKSSIRKCPECLSDVPVAARRCAHCSQLIVR